MNLLKVRTLAGEKGQAAVFITILLMFAFIALAALAIDGGHLYVVRRDLQNMADAACLAAATELALGGDQSGAYQAAVDYVLANGGTPELFSDPPEPEGGGPGLVSGIVVAGADIRVALQTEVPTYFTMIFNRQGAGVGARAHCGSNTAGGLLPIAIRRYDVFEPTGPLDLLANKCADPRNDGDPECGADRCGPEPGGDCPYPENSNLTTWEGREGPMAIYLPKSQYTPAREEDVFAATTGNIDYDPQPLGDGYVGTAVLGQGVRTNSETMEYEGFISLDIRNVQHETAWMLNGATGQSDSNKWLSEQWFHEGYWGPNPMVGDTLAVLDGGSTGLSVQDMAESHPVGTEFVAVIYSGYVWHDPELSLSIAPPEAHLCPSFPCGTDTVTYTVTLQRPASSKWLDAALFGLDYHLWDEVGCGAMSPQVDIPSSVLLPADEYSASVPMIVSATNPVTESCLSALTVGAREISEVPLGIARWGSTRVLYGLDEDIVPDFTMYAGALEVKAYPGHSVDVYLTTRGFGGASKVDADLHAELVFPADKVWGDFFVSGQDGIVEIRRDKDVTSAYALTLSLDAPASEPGTPCRVRLTVTSPDGPSHSVDIDLSVFSFTPGTVEIKDFVIVEGYAPFIVSYVDANTIAAYATGPITNTVEALISGQNSRLSAW